MPLSYHLTLFSNDIVNFVIFNGSSCPIFWVRVCTENEKRGFIYVFTRRKKKFVSIEYRNRVPITKTDVAHNVVFFVFFFNEQARRYVWQFILQEQLTSPRSPDTALIVSP